jgi:hypothetical protein
MILVIILGITPHALFTVFSIFPGYYEIFQLILTILNGAFTAFEVPLTTSMNGELPHTKLLEGAMVWASCFVDCCSS